MLPIKFTIKSFADYGIRLMNARFLLFILFLWWLLTTSHLFCGALLLARYGTLTDSGQPMSIINSRISVFRSILHGRSESIRNVRCARTEFLRSENQCTMSSSQRSHIACASTIKHTARFAVAKSSPNSLIL